MKVLFFIHCLIGGGAERVTVNLSNELASRGHDVTIVLNKNIIDYELDSRIHIDFMPDSKRRKDILRRIWGLVKSNYNDYKGTKNILKQYKPDIIIASWGSKLIPIILTHGHIPIIASEHNTFDRKHKFRERVNRFYLNRFFDKVVVLTEYDKNFTKKYLHNTEVIPNPLTFAPISHEEYEKSFSQRKNLLACGRIKAYHVKGFDNLIIAFSKIAHLHKDWDLDIAGAGSDESIAYLKQIASSNGVEERVHFLGFRKDISQLMKSHSIFALTSRSEGFGMVISEAMAMGCACVSYALTGPSEIISHQHDGLLVENQNVDKMSEALSILMSDESLRKTLGKNALESVRRFSCDTITDKWENLFNEVRNI